MAKYMMFDKEINYKTVFDLINQLDEHMLNSEDPVELNWDTPGGSVAANNILLKYINEYPLEITINATGGCESCGLIFLIAVERPVNIFPTAYGMAHGIDTLLYARELNDKKSCSHIRYEQLKKLDEWYLQMYTDMGMPDEDLELIKKGTDVNFSGEKLADYITIYNSRKAIEEINCEMNEVSSELEALKEEKETVQKRISRAEKKLAK